MRLDDVNRSPQTQATEKSKDGSVSQRQVNKGQEGGSDQAEISPLAQALQPADAKRLESLRLDVQSGRYQVSAEKVASAIVEDALRPR